MEQYGKILLFAMPVFLILVLLEKWYGWYKGNEKVYNMDMLSSLTSGITMVTKNILGLSITILSYELLVNKLALTQIKPSWLTFPIAFIAIDFSHYWIHRLEHKINFFWNSHIVHHSSEEFNLACALRKTISSFIKLFTFLLLPAALLGVPSIVIATITPIHFFAQFWYHTRYIDRMGFIEKILVTPSHHRVHHAINKEYLDKNLSQIFIVWDKLFGTFQQELPDVPPVYGITRPVQTWNPIKINAQHMWLLITDSWRTKSIKDKFRIWVMPTGWRPADVEEKYPVFKINDVYHFEKYGKKNPLVLSTWTWVQMLILFFFVSYLLGNIATIGNPNMFIYGFFVFMYVYALTELMDGSKYAIVWEFLKAAIGIAAIFYIGDWFGVNSFYPWVSKALIGYFILSVGVTGWLAIYKKNDASSLILAS